MHCWHWHLSICASLCSISTVHFFGWMDSARTNDSPFAHRYDVSSAQHSPKPNKRVQSVAILEFWNCERSLAKMEWKFYEVHCAWNDTLCPTQYLLCTHTLHVAPSKCIPLIWITTIISPKETKRKKLLEFRFMFTSFRFIFFFLFVNAKTRVRTLRSAQCVSHQMYCFPYSPELLKA